MTEVVLRRDKYRLLQQILGRSLMLNDLANYTPSWVYLWDIDGYSFSSCYSLPASLSTDHYILHPHRNVSCCCRSHKRNSTDCESFSFAFFLFLLGSLNSLNFFEVHCHECKCQHLQSLQNILVGVYFCWDKFQVLAGNCFIISVPEPIHCTYSPPTMIKSWWIK